VNRYAGTMIGQRVSMLPGIERALARHNVNLPTLARAAACVLLSIRPAVYSSFGSPP
jgi:hypothetical protein